MPAKLFSKNVFTETGFVMFERKDAETERWSEIIKSETPVFDLKIADILRYKDLLFLFVRRDFTSIYKQTILGPLWFILQPLLTTFIFVLIFSKGARIPTDGYPAPVFYLSGLVAWNYFSSCLQTTANSFIVNANLFGKVYFPRLIVPLSGIVTGLISFALQFVMLLIIMLYYHLSGGFNFTFTPALFFIPVLIILMACLSLGWGLMIAALTTKYRDLSLLIAFGIQLFLYLTPVIYPLSFFSERYRVILLYNPLAPLIEFFRAILLGTDYAAGFGIYYSAVVAILSLVIGIILFNRAEKTFTDVI